MSMEHTILPSMWSYSCLNLRKIENKTHTIYDFYELLSINVL